jgi:hypothetical protein
LPKETEGKTTKKAGHAPPSIGPIATSAPPCADYLLFAGRLIIAIRTQTGAAVSTSVTLPGAPALAGCARKSGRFAQRSGSGFAGTAIPLDFEVDLLAFDEAVQASTLDGGNVDEDVLTAIIGLDEAEALGGVEPLDRSSCHLCIPSVWYVALWREPPAEGIEILEIERQQRVERGPGSIGRNINEGAYRGTLRRLQGGPFKRAERTLRRALQQV